MNVRQLREALQDVPDEMTVLVEGWSSEGDHVLAHLRQAGPEEIPSGQVFVLFGNAQKDNNEPPPPPEPEWSEVELKPTKPWKLTWEG